MILMHIMKMETIHLFDNTSDGYNGCSKIIYENFENIIRYMF